MRFWGCSKFGVTISGHAKFLNSGFIRTISTMNAACEESFKLKIFIGTPKTKLGRACPSRFQPWFREKPRQ